MRGKGKNIKGFSFNDIILHLGPSLQNRFKHLTNYPDSDVKSMGSI